MNEPTPSTPDNHPTIPEEIENTLLRLKEKLEEKFPCGIPRKKIGEATGYVLHPRTCRNEDSLGNGIAGRYKVGRNTVYPVDGVVSKIKSKLVMA